MSDQKEKSQRAAGFLQPNERAFLADEGVYYGDGGAGAESGEEKARSRIKNEVASITAFRNLIETFQTDLMAVAYFQMRNPESPYEWQMTLEHAKPRIESLRKGLDSLLEMAEEEYVWDERERLKQALAPLYRPIEEEFGGAWVASEQRFNPEERESGLEPDALEAVYQRQKELQQLLNIVLSREDRLAILQYLQSEGKTVLKGQRVGGDGEPWARVASRELAPELVIKDDTWSNRVEYELTDTGEAVLACWEELQAAESIKIKRDLNPDMDDKELVLNHLKEFFSANFG